MCVELIYYLFQKKTATEKATKEGSSKGVIALCMKLNFQLLENIFVLLIIYLKNSYLSFFVLHLDA